MRAGAAALLLLLCAAMTRAQIQSADLSGRVTTQEGSPIPGASVSAVNVATGATANTQTNRGGVYLLTGMAAGEYRLSVSKFGFKMSIRSNVQLHAQSQVSENIRMELGYALETVSSRSTSWSDETAPSRTTTVGHRFPQDLPLNGRSFEPLLWMVPGYTAAETYYTSPGQFSFNGRRTTDNYITVDGASVMIGTAQGTDVTLGDGAGESLPAMTTLGSTNGLVSLEEIQEFNVQSNGYEARFGHLPGAQISILTRSGTNTLHMQAFEFFRNQDLDASDWFTGYNGLARTNEQQNDLGLTAAGPLWRNRLFAYGGVEFLKLTQPTLRTELVPTAEARAQAPAALGAVLSAFPLPNRAGGDAQSGNFAGMATDSSSVTSASLRLDTQVGHGTQLFLRGALAPSHTAQRGAFDYYTASTMSHTYANLSSLTAGANVHPSGQMVYEVRANVSDYAAGTTAEADDFGGATPPTLAQLFSSAPAMATETSQFTAQFGADNNGFYVGPDAKNRQRQYAIAQEFEAPLHTHLLAAGFDFRLLTPVNDFRPYTTQYVFHDFATAESTATTDHTYVASSGSGQIELEFRNFAAYVQDSWRPTPRWRLSYGLRWDADPPPHDRNGHTLWTVLNLDRPAEVALAAATAPLWKNRFGNVAPRLGLGYELRTEPGWETQLHANLGLFYGLGSTAAARVAEDAPYLVIRTLGSTAYPLTSAEASPPPLTLSTPYSLLYASPQELNDPRVWEWNAGVEQRLGPRWMAAAEYVGSHGDRLLHREALLPAEGLNSDFSSVEVMNNRAWSSYNALQLRLTRDFGDSLRLWGTYTYAHSLDTASGTAHPAPYYLTYDPRRDYGSSDFDVRHTATLVTTYTSRRGFAHPWMDRLLQQWMIASYLRMRTALPVNVVDGEDLIDLGYTKSYYRRPDRVTDVPLYLHGSNYPGGKAINPAAFNVNTAVLQGTLGRNAVRGFGIWQEDVSLARSLNLTDNLAVTLRVDAFNVLNHPSFADPGAQYATTNELTSANFGLSTATAAQGLGHGGVDGGYNPIYQIGAPRALQLAVRVSF